MDAYPKKVRQILCDLRHCKPLMDASAGGVSAAFECGSSIRFSIFMEDDSKMLRLVLYESNGCGFMLAAGETISRSTQGRELTDLHGSTDLEAIAVEKAGEIPSDRWHCVQVAAEAFRNALANYRSRVVEEFQGEKALICTCFGVTEEAILEIVERTGATEVGDISAESNAGSGCGSCRLLIQELIDSHPRKTQSGIML